MNPGSTDYRIEIANEQSRRIDEDLLIKAVRAVLADYDLRQVEISIAIVDDPTMRDLNKRYLQHDYETDVLSFVLESDFEAGQLIGQLIVSFDTADRVATELKVPIQRELVLYVVHGMLHLVGFNDQGQVEAAEMREAERMVFRRLGMVHHWPDEPEAPAISLEFGAND
jgi:probable rRNA maturation factor